MLRPDLYKRMLRAIPEGIIQFSKAVEKIESEPHLVRLHFQDGTASEVEFLVGADGISSIIRKRFWGASPKRPRNLHVTGGYPFNDTPKAEKLREHWSKGRATLSGNAAHPTSPYATYGAEMSTCDGYFIGQCLAGLDLNEAFAVEKALQKYESKRLAHTSKQVQAAVNLGQMVHHSMLRPVRNLVLDYIWLLQSHVGEENPREIVA
ncbi:hypothetical protein D0869_06409 [Hortaea werneckii]|uniref:FAD-binding domain-containing protein n=1 Tax=Hortaea werneckii TaxID=91943 RepID=A0A3M6WTR9_HORWE|nr:hypothetical protein KC324_g1529 [Hortaea werneckii]KAI7593629.1 hypothetical protein KC316_g1609 [Hortaea werneckii]RMX81962.1 hypothetical protein D0869_06409 [Hortaea werneckii]